MKDLQVLTKSTVTTATDKSAKDIKAATDTLETSVRTSIINDVIKEAVGVDISGLASKKAVEDAQAAVEGKLSEQYITAEDIEKTYVTQTALTNKKYATESYVASKSMTTAMDFSDAVWGGLTEKFWSTTSQTAGAGYFTTKNTKDGSFAQLINSGSEGVVAAYYNSTSGDTFKLIVNGDGIRYVKNLIDSAGRELAVKNDIDDLKEEIILLKNRISELEEQLGVTSSENSDSNDDTPPE